MTGNNESERTIDVGDEVRAYNRPARITKVLDSQVHLWWLDNHTPGRYTPKGAVEHAQ